MKGAAVGQLGGKGQAVCPWHGQAVRVSVAQSWRSVGVTNEHVVTWEVAGTKSQFSRTFLANTIDLAE